MKHISDPTAVWSTLSQSGSLSDSSDREASEYVMSPIPPEGKHSSSALLGGKWKAGAPILAPGYQAGRGPWPCGNEAWVDLETQGLFGLWVNESASVFDSTQEKVFSI